MREGVKRKEKRIVIKKSGHSVRSVCTRQCSEYVENHGRNYRNRKQGILRNVEIMNK